MEHFFSGQATEAFPLSVMGYLTILSILLFLAALSFRYHTKEKFRKFFKGIQWLQIIFLYAWYTYYHMPLSESLPLYHCRIAMFTLLLLPNQTNYKRYFALLGLCGSILAVAHPIFDPFPFWHVTTFSYLFGHYALFVNAIVYLLNDKQLHTLSTKQIIRFTFVLNALLILANWITGGNYGFLQKSPIINNQNVLINYLLVSSVLACLIAFSHHIFSHKVKDGLLRKHFLSQ